MNANEAAVRNAYQVAERKDYAGWVNCFTEDGTFTDESIGATYRGKELSRPVEVYAARISRHASRVVPVFRRRRYGHRRVGTPGNAEGTAAIAPGNHTADRQTDGRAVLRRVSLGKRQDSILQLLSVRHGDFGAIGRSANLEMSVSQLRKEDSVARPCR